MNTNFRIFLSSMAMASTLSFAGPACGDNPTPSPAVKASFKKLVSERAQLVRTLDRLDERAADAITQGLDPIEIHAEQTAYQDELDLLQLRLESMAIRHTLALPEVPQPGEIYSPSEQTEQRARNQFRVGKERTGRVVRQRTRDLLARLDFQRFILR